MTEVAELEREILAVIDELRGRCDPETFKLVLRLEELLNARTADLLDRERHQSHVAN